MKRLLNITAVALVAFAIPAMGATYRIKASFPKGVHVGKPSILQFSLYRGTSTEPLPKEELKLEHEKLIHLLALDAGFEQYHHEHPEEVSKGVWEVPINVTIPGNFRFWAQFKPDGEANTKTVVFDQVFSRQPGEVLATQPKETQVRHTFTDGPYTTTLTFPQGEPIQHKNTPIKFTVTKNGVAIPANQLEMYLGARMHVVGVSGDRKDFAHAHPGHEHHWGEWAEEEDVTKMHFMQTGYYVLYIQYSHEKVVRTSKFGLTVKAQPQDIE